MRVARLVGLSPDGRFVIVATETGEELAIAADDRLRAALRGDRPRLGQLENKMESALSPREIQTRIRSGESVEDVARVAGVDRDRVERFAAPVIAEREHVAGLAMTSSARRRGETSAHRTLRGARASPQPRRVGPPPPRRARRPPPRGRRRPRADPARPARPQLAHRRLAPHRRPGLLRARSRRRPGRVPRHRPRRGVRRDGGRPRPLPRADRR